MTRKEIVYPIAILLALLAAPALALAAPGSSPGGLTWETLEVDREEGTARFQLGRLQVPARHDDPEGPGLEIAFVRLPAYEGVEGDPIVYLSGGPGQSATPLVRSAESVASLDPFRSLGDVILLDQRGTGRSTPDLSCGGSGPPHPELFVPSDEALEEARNSFEHCVRELRERGVDLGAYTTRESADDLELLRRALGAERLRLVGFSYGTHLALATVRRHGDRLGPVVLVGTEGPDHTWKLPSTMDLQIEKLARMAAADPSVGPPLEGAGGLGAVLDQALAELARKPLEVTVHDRLRDRDVVVPVGPDGFRRILLWDLGDTHDLPYFPALIHQVAHRDGSLLTWFVTKRYHQVGRGFPAMGLAMDCASGVSPTRRLRIETEARGSRFGNVMNDLYTLLCPVLGNPDLGEAYREPLASAVPTLFVSGILDANTPPFQAEELRWGFPRAQHLVVDNAGHEDMLGNPEVGRAIVEFLGSGRTGTSLIELPAPELVPLDTPTR